MTVLRKCRMAIVIFAFMVLFVGALSIVSTDTATATNKCCIWVMYCPTEGPGPCWEACVYVPCHR